MSEGKKGGLTEAEIRDVEAAKLQAQQVLADSGALVIEQKRAGELLNVVGKIETKIAEDQGSQG